MSYNILAFDVRFYTFPDLVEGRRAGCFFSRNAMDVYKAFPVNIAGRLNQDRKFASNNPLFNTHEAHLANAPAFAVCCFKIDGCKAVSHR